MDRNSLTFSPVEGKTYSLFGNSQSPSGYVETVRMVSDKTLEVCGDPLSAINIIQNNSSHKRKLKKLSAGNLKAGFIERILYYANSNLSIFTGKTEEHLRTLPISKIWDRRLATSREQYHLYMIEIELVNRLSFVRFRHAEKKIALLPYCLRDFGVECKSAKTGFDYQCRHCSSRCFQNHASTILEKNNIEPYIWMGGDMKQLVK